MEQEKLGGALIIAALMLAISILGSTFFVAQAIDRTAQRIAQVGLELEDWAGARDAAPRREPSREARRPARPSPTQRYDVDIAGSPARGGDEASVTIVEWSDFQCPFCSRVTPTLERVSKEYGDDVKIVFKHMPLPMHTKAPAAHAAAEAAHRQGRFWEMHDRIFAAQSQMDPDQYVAWAEDLGLDMDRFRSDMDSAAIRQRIDADMAQAGKLGVTGTPAFFINGRFLSGAQPYESFKRVIDEELRKAS